MQNSIVKVSKCFNIFYTIFTQVLDKIENFEFPRNAQCLLSASLKTYQRIVERKIWYPSVFSLELRECFHKTEFIQRSTAKCQRIDLAPYHSMIYVMKSIYKYLILLLRALRHAIDNWSSYVPFQ